MCTKGGPSHLASFHGIIVTHVSAVILESREVIPTRVRVDRECSRESQRSDVETRERAGPTHSWVDGGR